MVSHTFLVFGDLHGRILPAFRLALAWQREHGERLSGLLQAGDLGFFPDPSRLDKATKRYAEDDPLELGAQLIAVRSHQADAIFAEPELPDALWFTAGNHEDHAALDSLAHGTGCTRDDFPVDFYHRVRCVRDGHVITLPGGLRVGALWGIDDQAPNARRKTSARGRISQRSATMLSCETFDVLLTHESPRDAMILGAGSDAISFVIELGHPAFVFFGHYHGDTRFDPADFAPTRVFHLHGLEFRERGGCAETNSIGVLRWEGEKGQFEYVDPSWLRTFTRHNWKYR